MQTGPLCLFSTAAYAPLRAEVARLAGGQCGEVVLKEFPDGERYQRIASPVDGRDVALLGGTISDRDTLELYDLAWGLTEAGARSLTLVIPYFGYSTMERSVQPGEVVTAKARARLLSAIPAASCGNRIVLLDLHAAGIAYYFEAGIRPVHLYGKSVIAAAVRRLGGEGLVLACTDAGRAKWVESLANDLGVPAAFVFKRRIDGRRTEVTGVSAQVEGKKVVIYDDMIRTGGSLLQAARAYRDAGAAEVSAVTTHGLFPGNARDELQASGLLTRIVCTDSHPRAVALRNEFLEVETIAGVLGDYLRTLVTFD